MTIVGLKPQPTKPPILISLYTVAEGTPLAHNLPTIFIETPIFTKRLSKLLDDDSYAEFQRQLSLQPDAGDIIEGTGGIRKIRVASSGQGKRGGSRVIYYHFVAAAQIAAITDLSQE